MSNKLSVLVEKLKATIGARDTKQASLLIDAISQYLEEQLSDAEQDLAIEKILNFSESVVGFIRNSLQFAKLFKEVNKSALSLIKNVIEKYKQKVVPYAESTVNMCISYLFSHATSAAEKEKATQIIHEIVANNLCENVNRTELLNDLFKAFDWKKPPGSVLRRVYELIGLLVREYADCVTDDDQPIRIKDMFFQTLEKSMLNQQSFTYAEMTGALNGFRYFLVNFMPVEEQADEFIQRLYTCIVALSRPDENATNREMFRAAMHLLTEHSAMFAKQLFQFYEYWHQTLLEVWLPKQGEDRKVGIYLSHAFHQQISEQLLIRNNQNDIVVLEFFISYFKRTMQSPLSHSYEIRIAIRGFGVMAAPCKALMPAEKIDQLLSLIMQRTENAARDDGIVDKDILEHFPDLVQALSQIMNHVDSLSGIQLSTLQKIMTTLIRHFHFLSSAHHALVVNSLMMTFHHLSRLGDTVLDDVLAKVIYQGVIWTCSHHLVYDAGSGWETITDWKEHLTYVFYLPLWQGLLIDTKLADFNRPAIVRKIYDHFMKTLFRILDKLDLSTKKRVFRDQNGIDQELYFCDPNYDYEPVKVKDFHIFFNIVDFYKDILNKQIHENQLEKFPQWINQYVETMIKKSLHYPLVSGFYKLLQLGLKIASKIDYFTEELELKGDETYVNVSDFYKLTVKTAQRTFGELQLSCLHLLLTAPMIILKKNILSLIPVFKIAFKLGQTKTILYIASIAVTALERIIDIPNQSTELRSEFLKDVLPCLDPYLHGLSNEATSTTTIELVPSRGSRRAKKMLKITEGDLLKFQKRIILILGKLEPEECLYLVAADKTVSNLVRWGVQKRVKLTLHDSNCRPIIYLDSIMPHICEVARTATERQKRIPACEIVHSVVLYLIGNNYHHGVMWSEICKCILQLGCDSDAAVQQMFEPLLMQIMHYLSRRDQNENASAKILMKHLLDNISHPTQSAVRDLAARCLREFLVWTIKQTMGATAVSPHIGMLIEKLKLYCADSSQHKRMGASLAFNNLYRVLREEEQIVDIHWLDLFHSFCISYLTCEEYGLQVNTIVDLDQISTTLNHLTRVMVERHVLLNRENERRYTIAFTGTTLKNAVIWLFGQSGSRQSGYRRKCIEMFNQLGNCLIDHNSAAHLIASEFTLDRIIELFENNPEGFGIRARPTLLHVKDSNMPYSSIHNWLEHLLASLECYTWLVANDLISNAPELMQRSVILHVISYFLDHVLLPNFADLLIQIDCDLLAGHQIDIRKVESACILRRKILISIFNLFIKLLQTNTDCIPAQFWSQTEQFIPIIGKAIFEPEILGFDLKCHEEHLHFTENLEKFIIRICQKAPADFAARFQQHIATITSHYYKQISDDAKKILSLQDVKRGGLSITRGLEMIFRLRHHFTHSATLNQYLDLSAAKTLYELFEGAKEVAASDELYALSGAPDTVEYSNHVMRISLYKKDIHVELIDLILNGTELRLDRSADAQTIRQGKHFFNLHKNTLLEYFANESDKIISRFISRVTIFNMSFILKIFIDFTDFVYRNKHNERAKLQTIANTLLRNWPLLELKAAKVQGTSIVTQLIEMMTNVAVILPEKLHEIARKADGFEQWLLNIIETRENRLELKAQAVVLLPCIVGCDDHMHETAAKALNNLGNHHFPLLSAELPDGSIERLTFMNVFQALLDALVASKSAVVLRFLINFTAADAKHIMEYKIQQAIEKYVSSQNPEQQMNALDIPYGIFCDTTNEPMNRVSINKRFLVGMLRKCSDRAIVAFYTRHIKEIVKMSDSLYGIDIDDWDKEHAFVNRIGAYELIEVLFGSLRRDQTPDISEALCSGSAAKTNKEIVGYLSRKAYMVRSETFVSNDTKHMELFRKYQCAAYKALCVIITNTQTELRFYENILFQEKPSDGSFIWKHIINTSNAELYTDLAAEVDRIPKTKERLVLIRRSSQASVTPSAKYIESQTVFDSSLSQDLTKIDLSYSSVRTNEEVQMMQTRASSNIIVLEKNSINDHELMAPLCAVIRHMFELQITTTSASVARKVAPEWVKGICRVLGDRKQHPNIRYFLSMVVDNCREHFRQYASTMTLALLQVLTSDCNRLKIDAFVIYLVVTLLEWNEVYTIETSEEISLASELLQILMRAAWSERKAVLKKNLDLIKSLIEIWRDVVHLPRQYLINAIGKTRSPDARDNICGLQLNGIVLANDLCPWTDTTKLQYFQSVLSSLLNNHTGVYQPASQVLGMVMARNLPVETEVYSDEQMDMIKRVQDQLGSIRKANEKKFCDCLYGIHKYYAPVVDPFLSQITAAITPATGAAKRVYLEMFLSRIHTYETNIFRELSTIRIQELLRHKEYQVLALHIINKILPTMNKDEVQTILPGICEFVKSKNSECRDIMYEIMMYIHINFGDSLTLSTTPILLNGLVDPDTSIQSTIFKFWANQAKLPINIGERIQTLFSEIYHPDSESCFLNYCAQLLLQPTIENSESTRQILAATNSIDSKLYEYNIDMHSRIQNSLLEMPLFMESQQRKIMTGESMNQHYLRATVNDDHLVFQPTLEPNQINQSHDRFPLHTQSSLLFSGQSQMLDRRSQRINMSPHSAKNTAKNTQQNAFFQSLRSRILLDKERLSRTQALSAIERHGYEAIREKQYQKIRANHATLYRRYRIGDYPDFQLNSLALLLPLQALAKYDTHLARKLMVIIFEAVAEAAGPELRTFCVALDDCIKRMFARTKICNSTFFTTLIEMALVFPNHFDINPSILATIAIANSTMPIGILFVEARLGLNLATGHAANTSTSCNTIDNTDLHWSRLADMYYNLSEHDIVADIFMDKLQSSDTLSRAIEFKSQGDFSNALKLYIDYINERGEDPRDNLLMDFAYESCFNCYENMGTWNELFNMINSQLNNTNDNYEELWMDDWNMNHLLPHYIRSKTRITLERKEVEEPFINNMDAWLRVTDRGEHIRQNFAEELMMLQICGNDFLQARVHSEQHFLRFLAEWTNLNVLSDKVRANKILKIRNVAEIHKYADWLVIEDLYDTILKKFSDRWDHTEIHASDNLPMWDTLIAYREHVHQKVIDILRANEVNVVLADRMAENMFDMQITLADVAMQQNNMSLSDKLIQLTSTRLVENIHDRYSMQWNILHSKYMAAKAVGSRLGHLQSMELLLKSWDRIDQTIGTHAVVMEEYPELHAKALVQVANVTEKVFDLIPRIMAPGMSDQASEIILRRTTRSDKCDMKGRLFDHLIGSLESAIALAKHSEEAGIAFRPKSFIGDNYQRMAMFCVENSQQSQTIEDQRHIALYILRGMQHNSSEARLQFPQILPLSGMTSGDLVEMFNEESNAVPEWMFIKWIPQIMSMFDFRGPCFLDNLLIRLTNAYPAAIYYPFQLSRDQYLQRFPSYRNRQVVEEILFLIKNPLAEQFMDGIQRLCTPKMMLLAHLKTLNKMLHYQNDLKLAIFAAAVQHVLIIVYGNTDATSDNVGVAFKSIRMFKKPIRDLIDAYGVTEDKTKAINALRDIYSEVMKIKAAPNARRKMNDFSPSLCSFQGYRGDNYLELPGQYTGEQMPIISNHIKIFKFDPQIVIFSSLREPMRLTIHGSDAKKYHYLVKYGEDLRQDERIQQLLGLMSRQLNANMKCREHQMALRTYQVVPLKTYCGLLTFVEDTKSMSAFLEECAVRIDPANERQLTKCKEIHHKFISEKSRNRPASFRSKNGNVYGEAAVQYEIKELVAHSELLESQLPPNLFKTALIDLSNSPESFFVLRNNFAISLATMNVANWILGIGDRHLNNILIDVKSGRLIGVDFGMSFGASTRDLPVPELLPCRFTPQFVGAVSPLGTTGLIKKSMIHALHVFRAERKLLKTVMEVFVKEPTIDWLESAQHCDLYNDQIESSNSNMDRWGPSERLNIAVKKLSGGHPTALMAEDLTAGILQDNTAFLEAYLRILNGESSIRSRYEGEILSVEDQVTCLLDMAQDKGILGITYGGIHPWI